MEVQNLARGAWWISSPLESAAKAVTAKVRGGGMIWASPTKVAICLVDHNDSLLIGKKYNQDSIKLTVNNTMVDIHFSNGTISFVYPGLEEYNNLNYTLHLSKSDNDTVNLVVNHQYIEDCGNYYGITSLSYNSKLIEPSAGFVYKIVKN